MDVITVGKRPLTAEDVNRVAMGSGVSLDADAVSRIEAARAVVEASLASGEAIYGLTTGVGHLKDTRLPDEELRHAQENLVRMHAGALGPPLPREVVRAAILTRINGISQGGSGAGLSVVEVLISMLNGGVHPVVPQDGSVGAADLGQMAAIALVVIGEGWAEYQGERLRGGEALSRAGIAPAVLAAKDGLALISSNGVSVGHGALVVTEAGDMAEAADLVAALSLEATRGNPSFVHPAVAAAKPYPGQVAVCEHIRSALENSYLLNPDVPASIQDPLSFRVVPQVHGALRDFIDAARRSVEQELNSMSDNPLVSVRDQAMVHSGNFHPIVMAIAFDALRIAIAHVGQLSERRLSHLWDAFFQRLDSSGRQTSLWGGRILRPFPPVRGCLADGRTQATGGPRHPGHAYLGHGGRGPRYRCSSHRPKDCRGLGVAAEHPGRRAAPRAGRGVAVAELAHPGNRHGEGAARRGGGYRSRWGGPLAGSRARVGTGDRAQGLNE